MNKKFITVSLFVLTFNFGVKLNAFGEGIRQFTTQVNEGYNDSSRWLGNLPVGCDGNFNGHYKKYWASAMLEGVNGVYNLKSLALFSYFLRNPILIPIWILPFKSCFKIFPYFSLTLKRSVCLTY